MFGLGSQEEYRDAKPQPVEVDVVSSRGRLSPGQRAGFPSPVACVWDLAVMAFEREAWIEFVLKPAEPDIDAYLAGNYSGGRVGG